VQAFLLCKLSPSGSFKLNFHGFAQNPGEAGVHPDISGKAQLDSPLERK
jgi:hypothetical protein